MKEKRLLYGFSKSETFLNDTENLVITLKGLMVMMHSKAGYEIIKML